MLDQFLQSKRECVYQLPDGANRGTHTCHEEQRLHILCLRMNSTSAACSTGLMVTSTSPALAAIMRIGHSGILAALPHLWDHAQLLQETQLVGATPMLHDLSLNQTIHVLSRDRDGLARWRDVLKLVGLGAVKGRTKGDGIPFGNHLLNDDLPVRKGRVKAADKAFERCRVI